MKEKEVSKFLSLVLRHQPQTLGIELDAHGWTDVALLLEKMHGRGMQVTVDQLRQVVAGNDKQRFAFSEDFTRIRASQGHSVAVDLGLTAAEPPQTLYHGTAEHHMSFILKEGLTRQSRQHVHLSQEQTTARKVGQRHGKAVILEVKSGLMHRQGAVFYLSENKVWLTEYVAPHYLQLIRE
jgi:putative RNA 2'-phosphotransferase